MSGRSDRELAAKKYADRESATAAKQRKETAQSAGRRRGHNHGGADRADRAGWRWLDKQP